MSDPSHDAFIILELAADRIADAPQTGPEVVAALRFMRGKVTRWRLLYLGSLHESELYVR